MPDNRLDIVQNHFNTEAGIFDEKALKVIQHYMEMLEAIATNLPFDREAEISVIDIGCGTGTVTYVLKKIYPNARVKCVDFAEKMLDAAGKKLKKFKGIEFEQADIANYVFKENVDAVVSSLALHHLETDDDKKKFQIKVFQTLNPGGAFVNADIILAADDKHQQICLDKWAEFVRKSLSEEETQANYQRYLREDRPAKLINEIENLKAIGFKDVEVYWRYYNFAVYGGIKT